MLEYSAPQLDDRDAFGKKVLVARGGDKVVDSGYISLQSESHPIEFRRVELKRISDLDAPTIPARRSSRRAVTGSGHLKGAVAAVSENVEQGVFLWN